MIASRSENEELCWWYQLRMKFCGLRNRPKTSLVEYWWELPLRLNENRNRLDSSTQITFACAAHANPFRPLSQMEFLGGKWIKLKSINAIRSPCAPGKSVPMLSARENQQNHRHSVLWLLVCLPFAYLCSSCFRFLLLAFLQRGKRRRSHKSRTKESFLVFSISKSAHTKMCISRHSNCCWET